MAAPPPHPKLNLNLLYPQGIPQKLPVKLLKWVLTFGRYIAIIVEIVVLGTFAARFKLDADLAELKEKINQQVPFIESLATTEVQIRHLQFKISSIKAAYTTSPVWDNILSSISKQTPAGVTITTLTFDNTVSPMQIKIIGQAATNNDLGGFLSGLKTEDSLTNINLGTLTYEKGEISFTITLEAKK